MAIVPVRINGREYSLACYDGQEDQLIVLSQDVDDRVHGLSKQMPHAGESMLLLMSALTLSDELAETKRSVRQLQGQIYRLQEMIDQEQFLSDQAKLIEMESAMASTLQEVASRIEKIAEQLDAG